MSAEEEKAPQIEVRRARRNAREDARRDAREDENRVSYRPRCERSSAKCDAMRRARDAFKRGN
mgnify:FL=1|jgi:hypothetical protein